MKKLLFALAAFALCVSSTPAGDSAFGKPNIVLCMADDQGWGDMAYNGHPVLKTPNFDALSKEGVRFDRFYAAASVCSPTRGSVMTGRTPNRFGCFSWGFGLRPQEITVAEVLKGAGYATGHFGKWHLGPVYKNSPVSPGASGFEEWISAPNFYDNDPILSRGGAAEQFKGESSMIAVDLGIDFIRRQVKAKRPFFAVVWFGSPHAPHQASAENLALYPNEKPAFANFYGEISGMDTAFGKLRKEIKDLGIRDNTVLLYCSDNGGLPKVGSTGGRGNKGQIYEGGLRVPALLEWPARVSRPRTIATPCSTVDIFPTLLQIAGAQPAKLPPLDGIDISPIIQGATVHRPKPLGFWDYPAKGQQTSSAKLMPELLELQRSGKDVTDPVALEADAAKIKTQYPETSFAGHSAWLDWPWKLHRMEKPSKEVRYELYNLQEDPTESKDLARGSNPQVAKMRPELEAWLGSVARSLNGKDY